MQLIGTKENFYRILTKVSKTEEEKKQEENGFTLGSGWKRGDVIHNIGNNPSTYIVPDDIN